MKVFVTGATGHLGQRLVPALERAGHQVTAIGTAACDLRHSNSLDGIHGTFDQVWHLATWTQAGDFCLRHSGEQWIYNQQINTHVIEWWRSRQPQAKFIAIGTSCCYPPALDLSENNYLAGEPVEELYSYAMTKRMLLIGMQALSCQFGLTYLNLVPATLFGPGHQAQGKQPHFIFDLIRKIILGKLRGEPVVLWGDGHQGRELVFTDDFVRAGIALAGFVDNQVINVAGGREYSIRTYAGHISRIVGFDPGDIRYDTSRYTGVRSKQLSVDKVRKLLPDFQFTPLEAALEETVRWHLAALKTTCGDSGGD